MSIYAQYHRMQDEVIQKAEPYPAHRFRGRGIVICAGRPRLYTCAWVLVRLLRDVLKTRLPIQVWHRGAAEMDAHMRGLLEQHGAQVVDACAVSSGAPPGGWALKPFAILHSPFQEVVFLDADSIPVIDPETLFAAAPYHETGTVFWPDLKPIPPTSAIWEVCRVPYRNEASFESGQMVLDKVRCWKALLLTMHMNEHAGFYYQHVYGDKDTFHMAWRMLDQPYSMVPFPPRLILEGQSDPLFVYLSWVLGQRDFAGRVILQHRNTPKFILHGKNPRYPGLVHEEKCFEFLDELATLWNGRVAGLKLDPPQFDACPPGARWFRYVRVSHDERLLQFLPDQTIGCGSSPYERTWRMVPDGKTSVLEILGDEYLICRLTRQEDGVWRGRWLLYERTPVELIPWPQQET